MKRTQIQLHNEQIKWLKQQALEESVSMSQLIRDSVDTYRTQVEKIKQLNCQKEHALNAVGTFSSRKTDH